MSEPIVTAAPEAPTGVYEQRPDLLEKKVDRRTKPTAEESAEATEKHQADLAELKKGLGGILFGDKPKDPKKAEEDKKAAAAKVDATDKKGEAEFAAETAKKKLEDDAAAAAKAAEEAATKTKVTKKTAPAAPDYTELARVVAAETARAINDRTPAPEARREEAAPEDTAPAHLSEEDRDTYDLFKRLSQTNPSQYKDKHKEFAAFVGKLSKYQKSWQKENPGEEFDPAAADHEDFYSKNEPNYSQTDLEKARIRREAAQEYEARSKADAERYDAKFRELESKAVLPEVTREAARLAGNATNALISTVEEAPLKEALAKGPDALKEADPIAFDVLNQEAARLQEHIVELHNIVNRAGYFDPTKPTHRTLSTFIEHQENTIKALPADQQMYAGKRFATRAEYRDLPPKLRGHYWTLTENEVAHLLVQAAGNVTKNRLTSERKRIQDLAPRYGFAKTDTSQATQAAAAETARKAALAASKDRGPSASAGAPELPTTTAGNKGEPTVNKKLVSALF